MRRSTKLMKNSEAPGHFARMFATSCAVTSGLDLLRQAMKHDMALQENTSTWTVYLFPGGSQRSLHFLQTASWAQHIAEMMRQHSNANIYKVSFMGISLGYKVELHLKQGIRGICRGRPGR